MTTGAHLHFEIRDCLYNSNFWLKSNLKGRHAMCIDPEKLVAAAAKVPETNVKYSKTTNGTYQLCGDVKDLNVKIVNQKNQTIEEPYCVMVRFLGGKIRQGLKESDIKFIILLAEYIKHLPIIYQIRSQYSLSTKTIQLK